MGILGSIGRFGLGLIPGGRTALDVAQLGLGVIGTVQGARQQGQANQLSREAIEAARADQAARQPFRDRLTQSFDNPAQREDLGGIFASENAFARPIDRPELGPIGPQGPGLGPIGPGGPVPITDNATANAASRARRGRGGRPGASRNDRFLLTSSDLDRPDVTGFE